MNSQQKPQSYADEKVGNGRIAVARFHGEEKDDTIITYWGNNGVCERALYLSPCGKPDFHLMHTETGKYDSKEVILNCNEGVLPPNIRGNMEKVTEILERLLK